LGYKAKLCLYISFVALVDGFPSEATGVSVCFEINDLRLDFLGHARPFQLVYFFTEPLNVWLRVKPLNVTAT